MQSHTPVGLEFDRLSHTGQNEQIKSSLEATLGNRYRITSTLYQCLSILESMKTVSMGGFNV
jgi:hypothetical protein